jgi:hypothetical protein
VLFRGDFSRRDSNDYVVEDFFRDIVSIGTLSFVGTSIGDLVISNKTTSIGKRAFRDMDYLVTVQIGS